MIRRKSRALWKKLCSVWDLLSGRLDLTKSSSRWTWTWIHLEVPGGQVWLGLPWASCRVRNRQEAQYQGGPAHRAFLVPGSAGFVLSQGHHDVLKLGIGKYNEECRGIARYPVTSTLFVLIAIRGQEGVCLGMCQNSSPKI